MPLAPNVPQCHHVRTSGVRCGSPAMRNRNLCYFHTRVSAKPNPRPMGMPSLEDGNAIQLGIAEVIRRVLLSDLEYRAAYVLLHAYKLALWNLKNVNPSPFYKDVVTVDPQSDPQNAGAVTEPLTYTELEELENPEPEDEPENENSNTVASQHAQDSTDATRNFEAFLKHTLMMDAKKGAESSADAQPQSGGNREGDEANNDLSSRAKPRDMALDSDSASRAGERKQIHASSSPTRFKNYSTPNPTQR